MSTDPVEKDELAELPPPRPTTPPLRRGFVWVLLLLCLLTAVVYGVPYMLDQIGYAYEKGRARGPGEARPGRDIGQGLRTLPTGDPLRLARRRPYPDAIVQQGRRDEPGF